MEDRGRSSSLVDRNSGAPAVAMVDVASPRIQTARKTWCSGRQAEAIRLFDEAIRWGASQRTGLYRRRSLVRRAVSV